MVLLNQEQCLLVPLAVWIQCTSVTDRQTDRQTEGHRPTASSALMQRLKINDDGTKVFSKKVFF